MQGSQSYLFMLHMILTMFDVPCQQGTNKSVEALQDGADAFLGTTSAPLSHRGHPNAFLVPSHTHSPGPTVSASGDGLCHFQTACQRSGRCLRLPCEKMESSSCLWACLTSQPKKNPKTQKTKKLSTFLIPSYLIPWHPESVLPMTQKPSTQLYLGPRAQAQGNDPTEFSLLLWETSLLVPFSRLKKLRSR